MGRLGIGLLRVSRCVGVNAGGSGCQQSGEGLRLAQVVVVEVV